MNHYIHAQILNIYQPFKPLVEVVSYLIVDDLHQLVRKPDAADVVLDGHTILLSMSGGPETESGLPYSRDRLPAPI